MKITWITAPVSKSEYYNHCFLLHFVAIYYSFIPESVVELDDWWWCGWVELAVVWFIKGEWELLAVDWMVESWAESQCSNTSTGIVGDAVEAGGLCELKWRHRSSTWRAQWLHATRSVNIARRIGWREYTKRKKTTQDQSALQEEYSGAKWKLFSYYFFYCFLSFCLKRKG